MKTKVISDAVKGIIGVFILIIIVLAFVLMPIQAESVARNWPELEYLKLPILFITQGLLLLFVAGLMQIIRLLQLFDKGRTFTPAFPQGVKGLVTLCVSAEVLLMIVHVLLAREGGPGPGLLILFVSLYFCIAILGSVLYLIAHIVTQAIQLRNESELTI